MGFRIAILILSILLSGDALVGRVLSPNGIFYKPATGSKTSADKDAFDAGLDRADVMLAPLPAAQAALGAGQGALNALITGWVPTENQDILIPGCTYSSGTNFTVSGDLTAQFLTNAKVRVDLGSGMLKGSYIANSSYATGTTTVILHDSILTSPLSGVWVTATRNGLFPYGPGYIVARDYGTPGQTTLDDTLAAVGVLERTLVLSPGTWTVSADTTIPANVHVKPERGAIFAIADTKTLTIKGPLDAGLYQIFSCTGTGKVDFGPGTVKEGYPEWWATNTTPGSTDMTAAIQAAIDSGAGIIRFQDNQTYKIGTSISGTPTSSIDLLGQNSLLDGSSSTDAVLLKLAGTKGSSAALGAGATSGDSLITCSLSVVEGDVIRLESTDLLCPSTTYNKAGFGIVQSTGSGSIVLRSPLYDSYTAATTTVTKINMPQVQIKGLNILRNSYHIGLEIQAVRNVEVKNVRVSGARHIGIFIDRCLDVLVDGCYGDDAYTANPTDDCYVFVVGGGQNCTVQNSTFMGGRHGFASGSGASGSFTDNPPQRNLRTINLVVDNDFRMSGASYNNHGSTQFVFIQNCQILNGMELNGSDYTIMGNRVATKTNTATLPKWAISVAPQRQTSYAHVNNNVIVNGQYTSGAGSGGGLLFLPYSPATINEIICTGNEFNTLTSSSALYIGSAINTALVDLNINAGLGTITNLSTPPSTSIDYSNTVTVVGWAAGVTKTIMVKVIQNRVFVDFKFSGTSDNATTTFTLPYTATASQNYNSLCRVTDNSVDQSYPGIANLNGGSSTVTVYKTAAYGAFTASGTKNVQGTLEYNID
jgi:hypothetical protein